MTKHAKHPTERTIKVAILKPCLMLFDNNERFSVKKETASKAIQNQIFDNVNFNLPINFHYYIGEELIKQERTMFFPCLEFI